jgi:hypothetical protein
VSEEPRTRPSFRFDEETALAFTLDFQKTGSEKSFEGLLKAADPMIRSLILSRGVHQYVELEEMIGLVQIKIWKGLRLYDPNRGRLYSWLTRVIQNRVSQIQIDSSRESLRQSRHVSMDDEDWHESVSHEDSNNGTDDLLYRLRQIKTTCTDPVERQAQRWLVESFISSSFDIRRHDAANSLTKVFGIDRTRARQLHDYTLLELRRAVLDGSAIPDADVSDLRGTRQKALRKYAKELGTKDFSRLVFLMKNLSSSLITDVGHVLDGFPGSEFLFDEN